MSGRRGAERRNAGNAIRGPQSALTDFLASNNISANQIRLDYIARRNAAEAQEREENGTPADEDPGEGPSEQAAQPEESPEAIKKRKRKEQVSIAKIKKSKEFAKRKQRAAGDPGEDDEDDIAWDMYTKAKPLPGQLENCELCGKRFTVTPYSKEGPDGGLLCTKCSKAQEADTKKDVRTKKAAVNREKRRKIQSNLLDGRIPLGAKTLQELCVEMVATNINDVDEFGDLPPSLMNGLSQILSKRRVITSRTLNLFLRPDLDTVSIYDCGKLEPDDFKKIFAISHKVENLTLENAGQFKDEVIDYLLERNVPLKSLKLEAANLINDNKWQELFAKAGDRLETLKLTWLDSSMDDETLEHLVDGCPNLKYLKLKKCFRITEASLEKIAQLKKLEQLFLHFTSPVEADALNNLLKAVGPNLRTLSLQKFENADDQTLQIIRDHCSKLQRLKFTDNDYCTDAGLVNLFKGWENPPLTYINLSGDRDMDPRGEPEETDPVGVASDAFKALMKHSGSKLERLNLKSCRHIPNETLMEVFDGSRKFPALKEIDVSFVNSIDTIAVAGMFKSCPALDKLVAFGCFNVKDVMVPPGVALIGVPHAQDAIIQEGQYLDALMNEVME